MIVVFAQMAQHQGIDGRIEIAADEIANHVVRQMSFAPHDALLDGPWVRPHLQHFEIVIGFEHQQVSAAQVELDGIGHIAQVGYQTHFNALRAKAEAYRIDGVVRNGEAIDFDIAYTKCRPGLETIQARRVFAPGDGGRGEAGDEDGHVEQAGQGHQAADVIGMLMRDEDGIQLFGVFLNGGEAGQNVALAEAGIDEDARFFGADESGISRAAGGEDADLDYDAPPSLDRAQHSGPRFLASLCVAHALLRAVLALLPTPVRKSWKRSHECERGTQECVRHRRALFKGFGITLDVVLTGGLLLPIFSQPGFPAFAGGGVAAREGQRLDFGIGNREL